MIWFFIKFIQWTCAFIEGGNHGYQCHEVHSFECSIITYIKLVSNF
jgi:hypothetical protein